MAVADPFFLAAREGGIGAALDLFDQRSAAGENRGALRYALRVFLTGSEDVRRLGLRRARAIRARAVETRLIRARPEIRIMKGRSFLAQCVKVCILAPGASELAVT